MARRASLQGHVFISYVREDVGRVDRLQQVLEAAGIQVWRDTKDLWPGEDWRIKIRQAIQDDSLVFIACFSDSSVNRKTTYQNEELRLAVDQLRQRRPHQPWLIPVRFSDCPLPQFDLGSGQTLDALQRVDLFEGRWEEGSARLVTGVHRIISSLNDNPLGGIPTETLTKEAVAPTLETDPRGLPTPTRPEEHTHPIQEPDVDTGERPTSKFDSRMPGSVAVGRHRLLLLLGAATVVVGGAAILNTYRSANPNGTTRHIDADTRSEDADHEERPAEQTSPTTDAQVTTSSTLAQLATDLPLAAEGLGPLRVGSMTLQHIADLTGVEPEVNQQSFEFSGGTCFEAHLSGIEDVTLWIRSPEPVSGAPPGVEDPSDGVLVALSIPSSGSSGSTRQTDAGTFWGMPEEDLVAAYDGELRQLPNPHRPDGSIYVADPPEGSGNTTAYLTRFDRVTEIRVGHVDLITSGSICY